jgi:L-alanine-DL-glutamate epimerase-like enolase superfamily enzyme
LSPFDFHGTQTVKLLDKREYPLYTSPTKKQVLINSIAHYYASTKNIFPAGEFVMGITEEDPICNQPFIIKNGYCNFPEGPGLGVEIDEQAVEKYALEKYLIK